jgi:hypothetical protein
MEIPDKWIIINTGLTYKVFATFYGGYLGNDSWKLNSGIKNIKEDENFYYFKGFSGSIYKCNKTSYGVSNYSGNVLQSFINNSKITPLLKEDIFDFIKNFKSKK